MERKLGAKTSDCAVVGDTVIDMRAGKNAGAKTVAVLSGDLLQKKNLKRKNRT